MLFVLAGPSYVGKKTALTYFMKLYSFSSIIPYTTKPEQRRSGEIEGIKYHFVDKKNERDIKNNSFIYDTPFSYGKQKDSVLYAYKKSDIEQAIKSYANFIIHASVGNAMQIYEQYHKKYVGHVFVIFLNYATNITQELFREKFKKLDARYIRSCDENANIDEKEFKRRYNHALKEINTYDENNNKFDACIMGDQPYVVCEKLKDYILPKLTVMPTSPDRIPGPLSDDDILYMSENRKSDILQIEVDGKRLSIEELKKILCGCGIQLSLSNTIRLVKKDLFCNFIDMAEDEKSLDAKLSKIYPEHNISTGYILKPNEVILCSSEERIIMPHDVYAIVSSKFSYTQLGLSIEFGTSIIQSGHNGKIHFQIKNNTENSICIYPGIQVVQLLFFRTVQPSTKIYREEDGNHSYDNENIAPVSRFYKKNNKLSDVSKPGMNMLKHIINVFGNELFNKGIGLLLLLGGSIWSLTKLENYLNKIIVPLWNSSSTTRKCFMIALMGCIMGSVLDAIGRGVIYMIQKLICWIQDKRR